MTSSITFKDKLERQLSLDASNNARIVALERQIRRQLRQLQQLQGGNNTNNNAPTNPPNMQSLISTWYTSLNQLGDHQPQEEGNGPGDGQTVVETVTSNPQCGQGCVMQTAVETATTTTNSNDPDSELRRQVWHSIQHNAQRRCTILFM